MRAIQFQQFGGYEQLRLVDLPQPHSTNGETLVQIRVAGVNPLDDTVRAGHLPATFLKPLPLVPGGEAVGVIVEPGTSPLPVGTRVLFVGAYGTQRDGTWQEYVLTRPQDLVPVPDSISDEVAAAFPVGYLTGQLALSVLARFQPGQSVLAPAVGGAVGNATVQLARANGASLVITTASTTIKAHQAEALGYENVIDLSQERLDAGVARLTNGVGVDVVIDSVGGPVTGPALASLARGGILVSVGYSSGAEAAIHVTDLIWRAGRVVGFSPSGFVPADYTAAYQKTLKLLVEGHIKPLIARTFPLAKAAEAQRYLLEERPFGRVLLTF